MRLSPRARRRLAAGTMVGAMAVAVPGVAVAATGSSSPSGSTGTGSTTGAGDTTRHPGPVAGCTTSTFSTAQSALESALTGRTTLLGTLQTRVSGAKDLPSATAAALGAILHAEQDTINGSGLAGLLTTAQGATTCAQLVATARTMVTAFRVYVLVAPQVRLTVGASRATALLAKATAVEPKIQAHITKAAGTGKNVSGAQQAFSDLQAQIATATTDVAAVPVAQILAQVPSDYPADQSMLSTARTALANAVQAGRAARTDIQTIRQDLR
ncbi:MAG: hypothetical protein M0Z63_09395 [Actinomycetota bacterium]|nr:hypothetical protein [Actinomycetota bacterium]MDA8280615.1 hypothetical protein [Actinomycetota bacterium]